MVVPIHRVMVIAALAIAAPTPASPQGGRAAADRAGMARSIDSLALAPINSGRAAGMSIAVVRGADTIVLKGYGQGDVELGSPTPPDAVYEIGSVTKQFTAAAVFQLRDAGALSLDDEITRFLPDYPTQGHHVTIRRLLNHTSGIKGYTEIPGVMETFVGRELPRDSLVARFAPLPFDFEPGDMMIYNNSAYFLLGLIIEKASGEKYEDYVRKHLFEPAAMSGSRYCPDYALVKHRVQGYDAGRDGLQRARYLVQIWPYAAGSLCSTAGDLVAWNRALHGVRGQGGTILSPPTYRDYLTPGTLNDGTRLRYANGLMLTEQGGRRRISHGGGIFGFLSEVRYHPDQDLTIVVLINTAGPVDPGELADRIEDIVLGKAPEPPARAFPGDLGPFAGEYQGPARGGRTTATVTADSGSLRIKMGNAPPRRLRFIEGLTFGMGPGRYTFVRQAERVTGLRVDQVGGYYILTRNEK